ncbi:MAG TPA: hypothetical protein VEY51_11030 [Chondromyces sp.]|nr:hypothetical protein [Chondromyces sp.]
MNRYKKFIALISIFLIVITGCSNEVEVEGNAILVQKRIGEENKYEHFKEITDNDKVQKANDILENIHWENAEVNMAYPPHYKFRFEGNYEQSELIYDLWISPNKDKIELVIEGESKYGRLSKSKSAKLFEIIVGIKLSGAE